MAVITRKSWSSRGEAGHGRRVRVWRLRGVIAASLIALLMIGSEASSAQNERCPGNPAHVKHTPPIGFNFETDSLAKRGRNGYREFYTCVRNHDDVEVRIIWYVPKFISWVPPTTQDYHPRMRNDILARPITGCLQYGTIGKMVYAEFLGTAAEENLATEQVEKECKGLRDEVTPAPPDERETQMGAAQGLGDLQPITLDYAIHFPSELKNSGKTLLRFEGFVDLRPYSSSGYKAQLNYEVTKAAGYPDGDPAKIRIFERFTGVAESLYPFFNNAYPDGFSPALGGTLTDKNPMTKGTISFEVSGGESWELASAEFEFRDNSEQLVGMISIPVFVPAAAPQ